MPFKGENIYVSCLTGKGGGGERGKVCTGLGANTSNIRAAVSSPSQNPSVSSLGMGFGVLTTVLGVNRSEGTRCSDLSPSGVEQ